MQSSFRLSLYSRQWSFLTLLTFTLCFLAPSSHGQSTEQLDCSFRETTSFKNGLFSVQQIINPINQTISVKVVYQGEGWVAYGVKNPSSNNYMLGAQVVIGLPDEDTPPQKWSIGDAYDASAITPFPDSQQTLLESSVVQEDGVTTMTFTKKLDEGTDDEYVIASDAPQDFSIAVGKSNTFGRHLYASHLSTQVSLCATPGSTDTSEATVVTEAEDPSEYHEQRLWATHGTLMMAAFGFFIPAAIAASLSRAFLPGAIWFPLHLAFNAAAILCVLAGFGIAVHLIQVSDGGGHFRERHPKIGLIVTLFIIIQGLLGIFRPGIAHVDKDDEVLNDKTENVAYIEEDETPANSSDAPPPSTKPTTTTAVMHKSTARLVWEMVHRLFGLSILGLAWYNCTLGMTLLVEQYSEVGFFHNLIAFWCVGGTLLGLGLLAWIATRVYNK